MEVFIIFFTILYAILAWKRLDLGTALLIIVLPVYQVRFSILGLPSTLLEVMIFVLFLAWFIKSWKNKELPLFLSFWSRVVARDKLQRESREKIKPYPFSREIIILLVIALISTVVAGFSNTSLGILKAYFIEPIMFFIVFINVFKFKENRENIFLALSVSAFIVSLIAIYQRITGDLMPADWVGTGRITGVFTYPNALGLYLGPIVLVLIGRLLISLRNIKYLILNIFFSTTIILSLASIYFAKSEGALIGILAALFIFGLLYSKKSRIMVITAVVIGIVILGINSELRHDVTSKVMLRDLDGQIRRQIWTETFSMLKDGRVIQGAGLANYQASVSPYHQEGIFVRDYDDPDFQRKVVFNEEYRKKAWQPTEIYLYPHNILLNFWVELGLVGMLIFGWIIFKYFIISKKSIKSLKSVKSDHAIVLGLTSAMIVIVVHGLVDVPYFKNDLAVLFWMLIAMMGIVSPQINKSTTNNTNEWKK